MLENIYTELIAEHSQSKENRRRLAHSTITERGHNPSCGDEIFLESDRPTTCHNCRKSVETVGYLQFDRRSNLDVTVPIFKDVLLYDYHMNASSVDFETVAAKVLEKPGKFGLQNKSQLRWTLTTPAGKTFICQPGAVQPLALNCRLDFGNNNVARIIANN